MRICHFVNLRRPSVELARSYVDFVSGIFLEEMFVAGAGAGAGSWLFRFFFRAFVGENSENSCGREQSRGTGSWVGARGFRADPIPSLPVPRFRLLRRLSSLLRLLRLFLVS